MKSELKFCIIATVVITFGVMNVIANNNLYCIVANHNSAVIPYYMYQSNLPVSTLYVVYHSNQQIKFP